MRSVLQPDLSVTGNASSRHERPPSGFQRRHLGAEKAGSTKSHIFGVSETPRQDSPYVAPGKSPTVSNGSSYYSTPEAPRDYEQQAQIHKISKNQEDWNQPLDVPVYPSPKGKGRRSAPVGVPQLSLGNLADDNNKVAQPLSPEPPHYHTPDTANSNVSWGTPVHTKPFGVGGNSKPREPRFPEERQRNVPEKMSQAPVSKRPAGMPALDLQGSQDDEHAFRAARDGYNVVGQQASDPFSGTQKPWNTEPKNEHQYMKQRARDEQEKLYSNKKKDYVVETVLVDQLSRAAISDPEAVGPEQYAINLGPKERKKKEFYNTRAIQSPGKSENLLAKRVRFGARLLTKNGHDIHRELNGFYFLADNTLTVYEFRQFGTRSSALPFIQRGTYAHIYGQKKGQPYNLRDIAVGSTLSFHTSSQNPLPQSVNMKPVMSLRITEVDEESKKRLIYEGCRSIDEQRRISDKLNQPPSKQEIRERQMLESVQGEVKKQLKARAVKTLMGLGKHFRQLDQSGDGMLDKQELLAALKTYRIQIPQQVFENLWHLLDVNGDGALDYGEFVRGFIGEMNESRKAFVRKVFHRLDPNKSGVVELNTIKKFFTAKNHPRVVSGELKETEVASAFLDSFTNCEHKGEVTYAEFEDYYEGVSIVMDSDKEFIAMMKNCWGC
ncbi:calcyphosin-2-like [Actinia tenebrosa]|uniref:Calcyphosin-2-like n=1 Tax=Actinia tenebrosa TaxID=6105 RepID=A0A6P8IMJ1_ACTTE|nr:calcyphosin-2-like [Actinia tenebrosa]